MNCRKQIRSKILGENREVITGYFKGFSLKRLLLICFPFGLFENSNKLPQFSLNYPDSPAKN
jgi:hypothetical protein